METEWPIARVGDLADSISETHSKEKDQLIFLNTSDILLGKILHQEYTPVSRWPGQAKKSIKKSDILFSEIRPANGRYAFVNVDAHDCVVSTKLMVIRAKEGRVLPRYLYYFLTSNEICGWLQHLAESRSGTFPQITFDQISELELRLPPLTVQADLAEFLDDVHAKIDINRRMNETLEAMARAIFKSWFVDFDPVRAKVERRQPFGMDAATAALFPDSFEDSPLGKIPKGWQVMGLSRVTEEITKGTTPTQTDIRGAPVSDSQVTFVRVNAITDDGCIAYENLTTIPESVHKGSLRRSILQPNDVLYTIAGTIGRIALMEGELLPANTNQAVAIIRPKLAMPREFLALTMQQEKFKQDLHANIVHAVQANLSLGVISRARAVFPPEGLLTRIFEPIETVLRKARSNRGESRALAAIRDALLPKLISGEIRLSRERMI